MIFQKELIASLRRNAGNTAIENGDRSISYDSLLKNAGAVTAFLLNAGLPNGTMVGILMNDRADLICSIIGILNARCIFVPVDPAMPEERLRLIAKELDLRHLISLRHEQRIKKHAINIENEYYFEDIIAAGFTDGTPEYPDYDGNDSAYLYFTSGSTGTPKGVVGKNSSLLQFLKWEIETFDINSTTRVSQFISPYFDAFLRDVFAPLLAGGTVCIPPAGKEFLVPSVVTQWISDNRINLIHCVPSFFRIINNEYLAASDYAELKYVMLSGEKIVPAELQHWYELFGSRIQLVNFYGATESTMIRAFYRIQPQDARLSKIPIGKPINDTELLVMDRSMKPCDPLVLGDLYIVSDYLSKGYFNNPALTNEKFVSLNIASCVSRNAYKTGDKARLLADGSIDLHGREDRQIKLRGIRIELDEIENVLLQSGFIKNAAVVARKAANGEEMLNAFVIKGNAANDMELNAQARHYLLANLPEYMVPSNIYEVDEFPLLSNGKINFKELTARIAKRTIVEPANETERALLGVWKSMLGEKEISVNESFHSMGGNSISIMNLIARIYKEFNVRISLEDIFNHATIQSQAEVISRLKKDNRLTIPNVDKRPFYNISSAQARVYYNYELNKQRTSYNLTMTWEIKDKFDKDKILDTLRLLAKRQEVLRTRFDVQEGKVVQVVLDDVEFSIEEYRCADNELHDTVLQFIRPFDLAIAPLMRVALIYTATGRRILAADLHHIICDGMTQRILRSDFYKIYYGQPLESLPVQYKDYAEWEHGYKLTEDYVQMREFWLHSFEGRIPQLNLPVSDARPDDLAEEGANMPFEISKAMLKPVLEYTMREELTASSAFFAIYYLFLSQLTGQDDIVVAVASAGRMQQELENVAGMFVKTLPIRYRMDTKMSFEPLVADLHNYLIQAISNQAYDLEDIMAGLNNNKAVKTGRLFNAGFVYLNFNDEQDAEQEEDFVARQFMGNGAKNAITLYILEKPGSFYMRLEYSHAYFTNADAALLVQQFQSLVNNITGNMHAPVSALTGSLKLTPALAEDDISFNF